MWQPGRSRVVPIRTYAGSRLVPGMLSLEPATPRWGRADPAGNEAQHRRSQRREAGEWRSRSAAYPHGGDVASDAPVFFCLRAAYPGTCKCHHVINCIAANGRERDGASQPPGSH